MLYKLGIDISYAQPNVDWTKIHDIVNLPDGMPARAIEFLILKISEGVTIKDSACASHYTNALAAGFLPGLYHFADFGDPVAEANNFCDQLGMLQAGQNNLWLDLEGQNVALQGAAFQSWVQSFIGQCAQRERTLTGIYSGAYFLNAHLPPDHPFGSLQLWLAGYVAETQLVVPTGWSDWNIWQWGDTTVHPAFNAPVDMDFIRQ